MYLVSPSHTSQVKNGRAVGAELTETMTVEVANQGEMDALVAKLEASSLLFTSVFHYFSIPKVELDLWLKFKYN